ncbi:hypothetical protein PR202_gb13124 [Eleusine coracana subsp. coracana]|uniref:F-box domain-containing protein n=1 Tax=Eleusine coracana subsp. coracana TaxID=191504 RepID=A0AAV5ESE0_ELECO|nr:hypothetical protein PR202_gb13124 [Eleusine coracana subsp. coracana]
MSTTVFSFSFSTSLPPTPLPLPPPPTTTTAVQASSFIEASAGGRILSERLHARRFFGPNRLLTKTSQSEEHLNRAANVANGSPDLPQEILLDIFAQLEVPDLVRAGSVCSSWNAAYTSLCNTGPCRLHQTPCLLYTSESSGASAVGLYSLAEKKAYTLTLPDPPIRSRHIIGSSYGWIITVDERCELHVVNPITREQIVLPSVTAIEQVAPTFDDAGSICKYLYACISSGEIHAFDLGTPTVEPKIVLGSMKHCVSDRIYIMKAPCGELLQIWRSDASPQGDEEHEYDSDLELELSVGSQMSRTSSIKIHKVDLTSKKLVEVSNLSEHVLFIGLNQSHCHLAEDYLQLKANNAYFTDDNYIDITWFKNHRRDIGVLYMANNSKEEVVSPQLWSNSPTPVWLIPNSRRMSLPSHN